MSIRSTITTLMGEVAAESRITLPPLTDDMVLVNSGLDSLAFAVLVARLEEALGVDPFTENEDFPYVMTLADLVRFYETSAQAADVAQARAS